MARLEPKRARVEAKNAWPNEPRTRVHLAPPSAKERGEPQLARSSTYGSTHGASSALRCAGLGGQGGSAQPLPDIGDLVGVEMQLLPYLRHVQARVAGRQRRPCRWPVRPRPSREPDGARRGSRRYRQCGRMAAVGSRNGCSIPRGCPPEALGRAVERCDRAGTDVPATGDLRRGETLQPHGHTAHAQGITISDAGARPASRSPALAGRLRANNRAATNLNIPPA